ncbi:MAG: phosphopantetheinyl transferase [Phenylobacterium sp.]|nr:phosphopantetheinyl transferase [Phenylobacterium sp.]
MTTARLGDFAGLVSRGPQRNELHILPVRLPATDGALARLMGDLTHDEARRARAAVTPAARRRFIAGRALLRRLLALRTGQSPAAVRLTYGARGKPAAEGAGLAFNLSHAGSWLLIAIAASGDIGVDVEDRLPLLEAMALAPRILTGDEQRRLAMAPPRRKASLVQRHLVLKEAMMKARGHGLALDPRTISVDRDGSGGQWAEGAGVVFHWRLDRGAQAAAAWAGRGAPRLVRHSPQELSAVADAMARFPDEVQVR